MTLGVCELDAELDGVGGGVPAPLAQAVAVGDGDDDSVLVAVALPERLPEALPVGAPVPVSEGVLLLDAPALNVVVDDPVTLGV